MRGAALGALLALPAAAEVARPPVDGPAVESVIEAGVRGCAEGGMGDLVLGASGYAEADLDGDGAADDLVIDFSRAGCKRDAAFFWSSGGAPIAFVLDGGASAAFLAFGWSLADVPEGPRVILLRVHGASCGGYGTAPCIRAVTVSDGAFHTMGGALDDF